MIAGHQQQIAHLKRRADGRQLGHGYIFFGQRALGKKQVALGLASYLEGGEFSPAASERLIDTLVVRAGEYESLGIDVVRKIPYFLWQAPAKSAYRTVIIDNAHALTNEAQNALLKTAEEPPPSALIILLTQSNDLLQPTLLSRFHSLFFSSVPETEIAQYLQTDRGLNKKTAESIAVQSLGQPGTATALLGNERFQSLLLAAHELLTTRPLPKDFIKTLIDPEDFNVNELLDVLIYAASLQARSKEGIAGNLWHRLLELRNNSELFNLNPRIQLEALISNE